jgi:hypothetical protein
LLSSERSMLSAQRVLDADGRAISQAGRRAS